MSKVLNLKVYNSFGSQERVFVIGHIMYEHATHFTSALFDNNLINLIKLFQKTPLKNVKIRLYYLGDIYETTSEYDGFFKFDFIPQQLLPNGWNNIIIQALDDDDNVLISEVGEIYMPKHTSYIYISDIDDTIMKSYSSTIIKRLYELLSRSPAKRRLFDNTSKFYNALAESNVSGEDRNPFFYVSSSEWNLYDYLKTVFNKHQLPKGVYLLNTMKQLKDFVQTGKTGHEGKLMRIARIILAFPNQQFILLGDNTQKDPEIYSAIAEKYPEKIKAVLIRNVREDKTNATKAFLKVLEYEGVKTCLFKTTQDAIAYCREIELIHDR